MAGVEPFQHKADVKAPAVVRLEEERRLVDPMNEKSVLW